MIPAAAADRLRAALTAAGYTVSGVEELLGTAASAALRREETVPARRRTRDGSPRATLVRLWPLQLPVPEPAVEAALPGVVDSLVAAGVLQRSGGEVRARVDVRPYADETHDWWVASDLTRGLDGAARRMAADAVLGVSAASVSLARLTVREPRTRALDIGTGSGVQALHLSTHADTVVATDVNPRCLELAALTAALSGVAIDLRRGNLYGPVAGERFDLVVSNPPFVVSPPSGDRLVYRDSGLPGDEVVRRVVTGAAELLTGGGWCQLLANWVHRRSEPWQERIGGWLDATSCDAWVVQRDLLDPAAYVELWLDDAGLRGTADYTQRYDDWLDWLDRQEIEAIGMGWISLRSAGRSRPVRRLEEWTFEVQQPVGPHLAQWARQVDALASYDGTGLAEARPVVAHHVVQETRGLPGEEEPQSVVLRQTAGFCRARAVSTLVAGYVGACDGELTIGRLGAALAQLLGLDTDPVVHELLALTPGLVEEGYLALGG